MFFEAIHDEAVLVTPADGKGVDVAATVGVGVCLAEDVTFSVLAGFRWRPSDPPLEYYFCPVAQKGGEIIPYWERSELPPYVRGNLPARTHIMDGVCRATAELLRVARPPRLFRATEGIYLPGSPGLAKHERVSLVFLTCGYVIEETGRSAFGQTRWVMRNIHVS